MTVTSTERVRKWRRDNPAKALAILRSQQEREGDKIKERSRRWSQDNPERRKEIKAAYDDRRRHDIETWARHIVSSLKCRCAKKGITVALTAADVVAAIPADFHCPALGIPLIFGGRLSRNSPSIDRLVPALGYIPHNVRVISQRANAIKQDCTDPAELQRVAEYLARGLQALAEGAAQMRSSQYADAIKEVVEGSAA